MTRSALITGVGRRRGIGAGIAAGLAADGWDLALSYWRPYDERLHLESHPDDPDHLATELRGLGSKVELLPANLEESSAAETLVHAAVETLGPLDALVMSHCEGVNSGILDTSVESFDRHYAVNVRVTLVVGAALMDIVYILIATFASSAIVVALERLIKETQWFPVLFQVACIILLLFLGIRYFTPERCEKATNESVKTEREQEARARKMGHATPFFIGILIAITNLASPTFLPSMIAFVGFLHGIDWLQRDVLHSAVFSVAFGMGTLLWFFCVLRVLVRFRESISGNFVQNIYRFAGGTLITFAAVIAYHTVTTTQWAHLM